ncbi:MAG TPA: mevalonate kinase [Lactobacillus sp.]|nr:mevalonate kinase [Lactobacillus sp.]
MRVATGSAHAKIILIGEHSVVHQQPAIAVPLKNVKVTATLRETSRGQRLVSDYFTGELVDLPGEFEGIRVLLQRLLRRFDALSLSFVLEIESAIPQERGMGSSAAVATAIVRAVYSFFEVSLDPQQLLSTVNIEETITHGSPSGIDAATVSALQPVWFVKGLPLKHFDIHMNAFLVVGDTGVTGQTSMAVNSVTELLQDAEQPGVGQQLINHLGTLTTAAAGYLQHNQVRLLGQTLADAQADLSALGVSHPVLQKLIDAANAAGALGAKLTGGGLGGCMFALAKTAGQAKTIAAALTQHGAVKTWIEPLSGDVNY